MPLKRRVCCILALQLVGISLLSAQDKLRLTIEDATRIGLEKNRPLHASMMRWVGAGARSGKAHSALFPSLKVSGAYTRLSDVPPFSIGPYPPGINSAVTISPTVLDNYTFRVTLQQPVFTGFRLQSLAHLAEYTSRSSEEEYNRDKSELVYNIRSAYWGLYRAMRTKELVDENLEQIQAHLNDAKNFLDQGMATRNEFLKVQVQFSNAKLQIIEASNNVQLATLSLNNMLGIPLNAEIVPETQPALPGGETDSVEFSDEGLSDLVSIAIGHRPEIRALDYQAQGAESGVRVARSNWFPQLYLVGNYTYARPNQRIFPTLDQFHDTWDVGILLSWDIWNWGATGYQIEEAEAELVQVGDLRDQLRDNITLEVTQAFLNHRQARERIQVSSEGVVQAEENYRITREKYKLGVALNSELLDAEVASLQSKSAYTQSLVDFQIAIARLRFVTGKETER